MTEEEEPSDYKRINHPSPLDFGIGHPNEPSGQYLHEILTPKETDTEEVKRLRSEIVRLLGILSDKDEKIVSLYSRTNDLTKHLTLFNEKLLDIAKLASVINPTKTFIIGE